MSLTPENNALSIIKKKANEPKYPGAPNWLQKMGPFKANYEKRLGTFRSFVEDHISAKYAAITDPEMRRMATDILARFESDLSDLGKVPVDRTIGMEEDVRGGKIIGAYRPAGLDQEVNLRGGVREARLMNVVMAMSAAYGRKQNATMYDVRISYVGKQQLSLSIMHDLAVLSEFIAPDTKPLHDNWQNDRPVFKEYGVMRQSGPFRFRTHYKYDEEVAYLAPGATHGMESEYSISADDIPALRTAVGKLSAVIQKQSQLQSGRSLNA